MSDPITKLDAGQVLQLVLDEDNRRLRTDATINTENLVINVSLDPEDDGVFIADKDTGDKLVVEPSGAINTNLSTVPDIVNLELELADTEYFFNLPVNTRKIYLKSRKGNLRLSFTPGGTGTAYITLNKGTGFSDSDIKYTGALFLRSNKPDEVIEILTWT